jgi:hypothetical protein
MVNDRYRYFYAWGVCGNVDDPAAGLYNFFDFNTFGV